MSTVRVCILGNSHLAALKEGWDLLADQTPGVEVTFFGVPREEFRNVEIRDRSIVPTTQGVRKFFVLSSGGKEKIEVDRYDLFILHALDVDLHKFLATVVLSSDAPLTAGTPGNFRDFLEQSVSVWLSDQLRRFDRPVVVSPAPFSAQAAIGRKRWLPIVDPEGNVHTQILSLKMELDAFLARFNHVPQPPKTITHSIFTKKFFSQGGGTKFLQEEQHTAADVQHMNKRYGRLVMKRLLRHVEKMNGVSLLTAESHPGKATDREPPSSKKNHPYASLPDHCFWRRTVGERKPSEIDSWYRKKFDISEARIATAGSCFAQHIGRHLRATGFRYLDVEPPPEQLAPTAYQDYGYGLTAVPLTRPSRLTGSEGRAVPAFEDRAIQ